VEFFGALRSPDCALAVAGFAVDAGISNARKHGFWNRELELFGSLAMAFV
jgi:hypothetical protein